MYLVTLFRLGRRRGGGWRGGGSKSLAFRRTLRAFIALFPFFLVSPLWPFFRRKISIIVGYDLIDFPLFLPPPSVLKNLLLPPFPLPPPVPYSPVLPPACPTPKTKMTSPVQLPLLLQSLCDHVKPND